MASKKGHPFFSENYEVPVFLEFSPFDLCFDPTAEVLTHFQVPVKVASVDSLDLVTV
jgi:hypothetical protein